MYNWGSAAAVGVGWGDGNRRALHFLTWHLQAPLTLLVNKVGDHDYSNNACTDCPMHACLNVDEILRLIAYELVASGRWVTAVALACCCKSFEDPVLDTLWETQYRLTPLLKSLPGDVWGGGECTSFKRLPTKLELTRFRKYAQRMREVRYYLFLDSHLSSEVFLVLHRFAPSEPLLPNLKTLQFSPVAAEFVPSILLLASPGTANISIGFPAPNIPKALVASTIATFPTRCPTLRQIHLHSLPRDPMIAAAVSELVLTTNRNTLRSFRVDSPLIEEAREVISKLPDLCTLTVVIERNAPLPSLVLPNLHKLVVIYDHDGDWLRMFHGATLEKLKSITFISESEQIGDFLGAFARVAFAASIQDTLSKFRLYTSCSWNPTYSSLLPFAQLKKLVIEFSCIGGCTSSVDDNIIISLARAMPKLKVLQLGDRPCRCIPTGVTAKGLVVLAHHCPNILHLCIHFQVASLSISPATTGMTPNPGSAAPRKGCALEELVAGGIPVPEQLVLIVALTLVRIFPCIEIIDYADENWRKVTDAISISKQIVDCSGAGLESGG